MATMVILEGKAKADSVERLKTALAEVFPSTRTYDGCHGITAYLNAEDERTVVFIEHWESSAHYERYLKWRTETGVIANLVGMLESAPSIRHFEKIDA